MDSKLRAYNMTSSYVFALLFVAISMVVSHSTVSAVGSPPSTTVINTQYGLVRGSLDDTLTVYVFHNIPFAANPSNEKRFESPSPYTGWDGILDCSGNDAKPDNKMCYQDKGGGVEDCLYLHLYVPVAAALNSTSSFSIYFWIYGGGFTFGDSWELGVYNGVHLASTYGVIVVSPNYRLNSLGFLALKEFMDVQSKLSVPLSVGIEDQIFAMQWVKTNAANFGGNPDKVTIGGESAGAFSVCYHLVSKRSKGLFSAAIMESGNCDWDAFYQEKNLALRHSDAYATFIGCPPVNSTSSVVEAAQKRINCLKSLPIEKFIVATKNDIPVSAQTPLYPEMSWGLVVDSTGEDLPDIPVRLIEKGQFSNVPVIAGHNKNEGTILVATTVDSLCGHHVYDMTEDDLKTLIARQAGVNSTVVDSILEKYPRKKSIFPWLESYYIFQQSSEIITDYNFVCSDRRAARAISKAGGNVWRYEFSYVIRDLKFWKFPIPVEAAYDVLGNFHTSELPWAFGNPVPPKGGKFSDDDWKMANTFGTYWTNLVKSGDPNYPLAERNTWLSFSQQRDVTMNMAVPQSTTDNLKSDICDFWDNLWESLNPK